MNEIKNRRYVKADDKEIIKRCAILPEMDQRGARVNHVRRMRGKCKAMGFPLGCQVYESIVANTLRGMMKNNPPKVEEKVEGEKEVPITNKNEVVVVRSNIESGIFLDR